jgi:hypothetical protein
MKHTAIAAMVFGISVALGTSAYAQGRHDDKPHGMPKDMPMATKSEGAPGPAGRHDERPHGQKKPAKKSAEKAAKEKSPEAK